MMMASASVDTIQILGTAPQGGHLILVANRVCSCCWGHALIEAFLPKWRKSNERVFRALVSFR